jgi:mannose-1-phosphate guanylyltransferase/mannose-6-phosphate isomerase
MAAPKRMIAPVLLSGGSGSRLWPVSRTLYPKQLLPMTGTLTMLQETARRFHGNSAFSAPLVVCNDEHRFIAAAQLQAIGIDPMAVILEPEGRNTAPAAAVAALILQQRAPSHLMLLAASDHVIDDVPGLHAVLELGATAAGLGHLVTFGIKPSRPETGYGYIRAGGEIGNIPGTHSVAKFVEKPDLATAKRFLSEGTYLWNASLFLFAPEAYLSELEKHAPKVLAQAKEALAKAKADLDFIRLDKDAFAASPSISIDYAVMEHTDKAAVVPADIGWSDVGSWSAIWERGEKDANGNVLIGDAIAEGSSGNLIRGEQRLVAAVGVNDLVIVETRDAVLVAAKDRDQDVKKVVDRLKLAGRSEASQHLRVHRPWGFYETLHMAPGTQVKLIEVNPGAALSLQYHHKRAEHWVVVSGEAKIVRGDEDLLLRENESTFIPIGMRHRLENPTAKPLQIIEVQVGTYLGEDDIVRLEDRYKRAQ